ncbi:MAG TPA: protein-disulfide reductase DsbD family protein [Verrucomicrobiota bacterium]|nr:protein-disulfide reductase DsbD family protein [Verrucomicrobiota bacterium]HNT14209.1 protein-disulfide reductase DsbD family protein [Verrucomicrobiota bacterium]
MSVWLVILGALVLPARALAIATEASLQLSARVAKPGTTITAAVRLVMAPDWHTYWENAGASGIPTEIQWQLPEGITAGPIAWPTPEKFVPEKINADGEILPGTRDFDQTTYVLHDEAVLLVPLTLAPQLAGGTVEIKAVVHWLECKISCIPGQQTVTAALDIGPDPVPQQEASFAAWKQRLPQPSTALQPRAEWDGQTRRGDSRPVLISWKWAPATSDWDFFPRHNDDFEVQPQTELVSTNDGRVTIRKWIATSRESWPTTLAGVLIQKRQGQTDGYAAELVIQGGTSSTGAAPAPKVPPESTPLLLWLFYAFCGGLILNIMPCVLPVIALKILGFVNQARETPARVRWLGLVFAAGVLASFLALAIAVIVIKAAGHRAGWGMQFSNPLVIVGMAALITLVALNLFGVFEVSLGGRTLGAAGQLAAQQGAAGAFFNGVLATILSTPCSAPFLGAALGFAFVQPPAIILLILLAVGLGLAAPYVLLSWHPAWLRFLPKPGAWMERFKIAMGFPMLITAIWLVSLVNPFYGEQSWWLGVFLAMLGAAAWAFGEFYQRSHRARIVGALFAAGLLVTGYLWALESGLNWRHPQTAHPLAAGGNLPNAPKGYPWQHWSLEAVEQARARGQIVVVDFTAAWCQTCKINVKPGFESSAVVQRLQELNAVALVADYTLFPPAITEELEKHGRSAVPMVLVYPRDASRPAIVLSEPLPFAPYGPVILQALNQAAL